MILVQKACKLYKEHTLQYNKAQHSKLYSTVLYFAVQYSTVLYCTVQYSTVQVYRPAGGVQCLGQGNRNLVRQDILI